FFFAAEDGIRDFHVTWSSDVCSSDLALISQSKGFGSFLVVAYGILALAALGRSYIQISTRFDEAPLSYSLSAVSAVVYIVALLRSEERRVGKESISRL